VADHRALAAIKALQDALKAANTRAGQNVEIGRASGIGGELESDAIDLNVGPDSPLTNLGSTNLFIIDSVQRVYVDLHTRMADVHERQILENIFQMRAQTHNALLSSANHTLDGTCISVRYLGTEDFDQNTGGDRLGSMRTTWDIYYRMKYSDATLAS